MEPEVVLPQQWTLDDETFRCSKTVRSSSRNRLFLLLHHSLVVSFPVEISRITLVRVHDLGKTKGVLLTKGQYHHGYIHRALRGR